MASGTAKKTSRTGKKPATKKKTTNSKNKDKKKKDHPSDNTSLSMVQYEIVAMVILAITLFVMISIYLRSGGIAGEFVRRLFFGVFGVGAWVMPIGIFVATFFKLFNRGNERLNIRLLLSFFIIAFISVTAHVIYVEIPQLTVKLFDDSAVFASLANYYNVSAGYMVGGGFIGALIGDLLLMFVGRIGTYVVLAVIFISLIVAITEQSFLMLVQKAFNYIVLGIKKLMNYIGDLFEERQIAKEERALEDARFLKEEEKATAKKKAEQKKETAIAPPLVDESQEETGQAKKGNFVASLIKSTIHKLADEEDYDIVKHIEKKEEQELKQREERAADDSHKNKVNSSVVQKTNDSAVATPLAPEKTKTLPDEAFKGIPGFSKSEKEEKNKDKKITTADVKQGKEAIEQEILKEVEEVEKVYKKPPLELLKENPDAGNLGNTDLLEENARKLEETLLSYGVKARVIDVAQGPTVTRYELQPDQGVKVSKIVGLADDIALHLAANGIRIEAPIPGKSAVGIEVPNTDVSSVYLKEVLDTPDFDKFPSKLAFGIGKDISGKVKVADIARMPHLLIAGATGSGKSVCVNTLITSILYKASPDEVKLLMIDPKVVELSIYNGIPHLLIPVVTDPKKAAGALNWAVQEMLERYKLFAAANVRDIKGYNKAIESNEDGLKKLPQIVIIVDELADLMVAAAGEVEEAICRLAQMARAAGLHLIIATQRPSVDVITGLIKANIPSRIAFNVSSGTDSRTIIDMNGAEKLLGKGDMLFYPVGLQKPVRIQGAFVSDKEIENIVAYLKDRKKEEYDQKIMMQLDKSVSEKNAPSEEYDSIFEDALELCVDKQKASASMIQRRFRVGYNRAARILDQLHDAGYVSDDEGSKPRKMLLTKEEFEALKARANGEEAEEAVVNETVESVFVEEEVNLEAKMLEDAAELEGQKVIED